LLVCCSTGNNTPKDLNEFRSNTIPASRRG
jgi:hypothetical protein